MAPNHTSQHQIQFSIAILNSKGLKIDAHRPRERPDMHQAVKPVKVKTAPERNQQHYTNEPLWIFREGDEGCVAVCTSPEQQALP